MHWSDEVAAALEQRGNDQVISTGISPSGEIHVGHLREVVTADSIYRALSGRVPSARLHYVADNFDPLRRVYGFLDPERYTPLVGRPLSEIPCPNNCHPDYGEHFLAPFLETLEQLDIELEVFRADRLYKSGRMVPYIIQALEATDTIRTILHEVTGKLKPESWRPFDAMCSDCGRITTTRVVGWSADDKLVDYACECGSSGTVSMAGGGKLTWRVDWPARWSLLGVTVEPFGKDHGTAGGSYDSGIRIAREVFGTEPPHPVPYEWISLKGRGDMSSSRGNVLSIDKALTSVPPEVLRYLIVRTRPSKAIKFDPGLPLLQIIDEYDGSAASDETSRAVELAHTRGSGPTGVPFRHLVTVAQIAAFDVPTVRRLLERGGFRDIDPEALERRCAYARNWLESFAPADIRFRVHETLPPESSELEADQVDFLRRLAADLRDDMTEQEVHDLVYATVEASDVDKAPRAFQAIYTCLLAQRRGPRAGSFIVFVGIEFVRRRLLEAVAAADAAPETAPQAD